MGCSISSSTIDSLLLSLERGERQLTSKTVIIVDEAGMTRDKHLLDLARIVDEAGGITLLVGDDLQLPAIGRGGRFSLLAENTSCVVELNDIWRMSIPWEKQAVELVRYGSESAIEAYVAHDAISEVTTDTKGVELATAKWAKLHNENNEKNDVNDTLLLGATRSHVASMNKTIQAMRIESGQISTQETVNLADGVGYLGDLVVTRYNDRKEGVLNGQTWTIEAIADDKVILRNKTNQAMRPISKEYMAEHSELGYASTVHRSQGMTCDKAVLLVDESWSRELFYVGVTRARSGTELVVLTKDKTDDSHGYNQENNYDANDVLCTVLAKSTRQIPALTTYSDIKKEMLAEIRQPLASTNQRDERPPGEWLQREGDEQRTGQSDDQTRQTHQDHQQHDKTHAKADDSRDDGKGGVGENDDSKDDLASIRQR